MKPSLHPHFFGPLRTGKLGRHPAACPWNLCSCRPGPVSAFTNFPVGPAPRSFPDDHHGAPSGLPFASELGVSELFAEAGESFRKHPGELEILEFPPGEPLRSGGPAAEALLPPALPPSAAEPGHRTGAESGYWNTRRKAASGPAFNRPCSIPSWPCIAWAMGGSTRPCSEVSQPWSFLPWKMVTGSGCSPASPRSGTRPWRCGPWPQAACLGAPALAKATSWLLSQQIFKPGDWSIKCPDLPPGAGPSSSSTTGTRMWTTVPWCARLYRKVGRPGGASGQAAAGH